MAVSMMPNVCHLSSHIVRHLIVADTIWGVQLEPACEMCSIISIAEIIHHHCLAWSTRTEFCVYRLGAFCRKICSKLFHIKDVCLCELGLPKSVLAVARNTRKTTLGAGYTPLQFTIYLVYITPKTENPARQPDYSTSRSGVW